MIIKIKLNGDDQQFHYIDEAEDVRVSRSDMVFRTTEAMLEVLGEMRLNSYAKFLIEPLFIQLLDANEKGVEMAEGGNAGIYQIPEGKVYAVNNIIFTRNGEHNEVVFDGEAYLCNNQGKTVERITTGGIRPLRSGEQCLEDSGIAA